MPGALCGSMVNTVRSLAWELVCIRALFSAHCSSSWCWKHCHASSAPVCHGSFSMLMTCCSSQTPRRSVSPSLSSRHGRLVWKVKGSVLTWRKPSSWCLVLTWMSYRNQASIPVLSAARVSATTPLSACSASYGSARGTAASLVDWWMPGTTPAPGVKAILCPLTAEQWPKWMLKASSLMWRTLSAIWVTYCAVVGAVIHGVDITSAGVPHLNVMRWGSSKILDMIV